MPELPEVENIALALRAELLGKRLDGIRVRFAGSLKPDPRAVKRAVVGRRLSAVHRHGKYLFLDFTDDRPVGSTEKAKAGAMAGSSSKARADASAKPELPAKPKTQLMLHLRMTGQVFINPDYEPDKHLRLIFDFEGRPVFYRDIRKFGGFTLLHGTPGRTAIPHVGPDMLEITKDDWLRRIESRRAPVKGLLLNQGIAAGLGNIYADEALFRAGIHPLASPVDLDETELSRLYRECRHILRLGIRHGGTTFSDFLNFSGKPGNFSGKLKVYGRAGEICRKCGGNVVKIKVAGRSSHFCEACQPLASRPSP